MDVTVLLWTLIFEHAPLWDRPEEEQDLWPQVDELLGGRKYTVFAVRKNKTGYDVEIAIPFEALDKMAASDWDGCRIIIGQTDRDSGEKGVCLQSWKTLWSEPGSIPGSESFYLPSE